MDDFLLLKLPAFHPEYKKWKKYGYKNTKEKKNLTEALENASKSYCMYCYSRIRIDRKLSATLEHAIEQENSPKLTECIPNIGITCTNCNYSLKKAGQIKRKLPENVRQQYENNSKCSVTKRKQCTVPCKALKELQQQYISLPKGQIILQPMGVKGNDTKEALELQYDILNLEFQPARKFHTYSEKEIDFIEAHIKRFHLNEPHSKTRGLYDFIKNVIDTGGILPQYEYSNWIVEQFYKQMENKTPEEVLKICTYIWTIIFLKI